MLVKIKGKRSKVANGLRIINPSKNDVTLILETVDEVRVEDGEAQAESPSVSRNNLACAEPND